MNLRESARHLRGITVCVDYADVGAVCLPSVRRHLADLLVVTAPGDERCAALARENDCRLHVTDAFYRGGAEFAKWLALEEALDAYGRHGWLCILDADVIWPRELPDFELRAGNLYAPLRHMAPLALPVPEEGEWGRFPIHRNLAEHAGYSQLFHADDPHLPAPPWHETDWRHAGGADSFFQARWPPSHKVRPPFAVLHLGEAGVNWAGRTSPYLDGTLPPGSAERRAALRALIRRRTHGPDRFRAERL